MKSLSEIEAAISRLPIEEQRQLVKDIPSLCPDAFATDGWATILEDSAQRPALSALVDSLDTEYRQAPEKFPLLNEDSLRDPK